MTGALLPTAQQWLDNNGNPLANGKVFTYIAGTSTLKASYSDYDLTALNTNPVILDAAGRASIWGDGGYKLVVKTADDATLYTEDNVFVKSIVEIEDEIATGLSLKIDRAGDLTPAGIFSFDVTGATTGYGFRIISSDTNHPSTNPMVLLESTDLGGNQPMLYIKKAADGTGGNANIKLEGSTVDIEFVEADQTSPAGKWEISASANRFQLNSRNTISTRFETFCQWRQLADTGVQQASGPASFVAAPYSDGDANAYGSLNAGSIAVIGEPTGTAWVNIEAAASIVGSTATYTNSGFDAVLRLKSSNTEWKLRADKVNQRLYVEREGVQALEIRDEGYLKTLSVADDTRGRLYFGSGTTTYIGNATVATNAIDVIGPTGVALRVAGDLVSARNIQFIGAVTGGSYVVIEESSTNVVLIDSNSLLAAYTITLPTSPRDTTVVTLSSRSGVTALTLAAGGSNSLTSGVTTLAAGGTASYIYRSTNTTWYRLQ